MKLLIRDNQVIGTATDEYNGPEETRPADDAYYATEAARVAQEKKDADDHASAKTYAKLTALKNMSPAEIQTWVTANVNTLAQAKDAIMTLAIGLSVLARRL
jgi:hypothetical protein